MASHVLVLRWGGSAYDSLGGLLELIGQEFRGLGLNVAMFTADGADWPQRLIQILLNGDVAFALTMSGIGADLQVEGKPVWDTAKIPLFNWSCDHPCYFPARHAIRSRYLIHGYVFPDHARYNIRHLRPNGVAFAVHLGIPPRSVFAGAPLPLPSRNGRIMFTKSGYDINKIEATWRGYDPTLQRIIFPAAETLYTCSTADFLPTLQRISEPYGMFLDGDSRLTLLLVREIDNYVRFKRAACVVETLRRYPVDVFGAGWDHVDRMDKTGSPGSLEFHGPMNWQETMQRLPHYMACVSTNPLIEESIHDRVFFALAASVVPISDGNSFARRSMPGLQPYMFTFSRKGIEQAIEAVLTQPTEALAQTEEAWNALARPFSMRQAASQILQFVKLHNLNTPCAG